jgi:hypothetical protein
MSKKYSILAFKKTKVYNHETKVFEMGHPRLSGHFFYSAEEVVTLAEKMTDNYALRGSCIVIDIATFENDEEDYEPDIIQLYDWLEQSIDPKVRQVWEASKYLSAPYNMWLAAWREAGKPVIW